MDKIQVGSRVQYRGSLRKDSTPGWEGKIGIVTFIHSPNTYAEVEIEGTKEKIAPNLYNLVLLPDMSVEKALEILRAAGEVTFKPHKPPFNPINVKINSVYTAIVHEDRVVVGCQTVSFAAIKELALAVKSAQEYARK